MPCSLLELKSFRAQVNHYLLTYIFLSYLYSDFTPNIIQLRLKVLHITHSIMPSHGAVVLAATAIAARLALASGPFKFCTDDVCKTCPVQVSDAGTGYPNCVVYKTTDVFGGNDDFDGLGSESG